MVWVFAKLTADMMNLSQWPLSQRSMLTDKVNDIAAWHDDDFGDSYLLVGCENGTALFKMRLMECPCTWGKWPRPRWPTYGGHQEVITITPMSWWARCAPKFGFDGAASLRTNHSPQDGF